VSGTAKMLGGADLDMSAAELQAEEGRGCARVCGRACSSGGRGCDSQLIGKVQKDTSPQLRRKKIARFTQHVVKAKASEIMCMYLKARMAAGVIKVEQVELSSRWFSQWRHEYGLSLRRPNRRYKVPKAVLAERLDRLAKCFPCQGSN